MTGEEFLAEYTRLAHAVQTGIAYELERTEPASGPASPKHLRTGLNCVMADLGSLVRLLVAKGVISNDEYFEAILGGLRDEVRLAEGRLSRGGTKITLV